MKLQSDRIFSTVRMTAGQVSITATDNTIRASLGIKGTDCVAVFNHKARTSKQVTETRKIWAVSTCPGSCAYADATTSDFLTRRAHQQPLG